MKSLIGGGLTLSLLWTTCMCVGMGMSMSLDPRVDAPAPSGHECCDAGAPKNSKDESGSACCMFLPGISTGSADVLPRTDRILLAVLSVEPVLAPNAGGRLPTAGRSPPERDDPSIAVPSCRAPPAA